MTPDAPLEIVARQIQTFDREDCMRQLLDFRDIPLDFTPEALQRMSTESLRHVLMAAVVTVRKHRRPRMVG